MNVKRWKNYFAKVPIIGYIVIAFVKCFLITGLIVALMFAGLWLTGIYPWLESFFDLGYNSPFIRAPRLVFFVLAVLSLFIGWLLYVHKYKRKKKKSEFGKALREVYADAGID